MKASFYYDGNWFASKEIIDGYANSNSPERLERKEHYLTITHIWDVFGEMLMKALHMPKEFGFMEFHKVKRVEDFDLYNVFYCNDQGEEDLLTVSLDDIINGLKSVELHGTMEIVSTRKGSENK